MTPMPGATEQEDRFTLPGLYCSNTVTGKAKIKSPPRVCLFLFLLDAHHGPLNGF